MKDFRVLMQYIDKGVPYFKFTTFLANDEDDARIMAQSVHTDDLQFSVVQVVESNGVETGFTDEQLADAYIAHANREAERETKLGVQTDG